MKNKNLSIGKSLIIILIAAIGLNISNVYSQGQENGGQGQQGHPMWRTSGNTITEGDFLGSTNDQPLIFKTNNEERFRVTTNNYTVFNDSDLNPKKNNFIKFNLIFV